MLLYIEGGFFQVLEGDDAAVDDVYARISRDPRHSKVTLIIREPIAARDFDEWTMGFSTVDPLEAGQLIGENDFFKSASCFTRLDSGRARKLLAAFRTGRWRHQRTGTYRAVGS
jgi:Sensors of blue-light using FAD